MTVVPFETVSLDLFRGHSRVGENLEKIKSMRLVWILPCSPFQLFCILNKKGVRREF